MGSLVSTLWRKKTPAAAGLDGPLLSTRTMTRLARFRLEAGTVRSRRMGDHRSPMHAEADGSEPAGARPYQPGDDLRSLDWAALARLDVALTRQRVAERQLRAVVLQDHTASTLAADAGATREVATAAALAIAWVGLCGHDAVTYAVAPADAPMRSSKVYEHPGRFGELAEWVRQLESPAPGSGRGHLATWMDVLLARRGAADVVFFVTDGLFPLGEWRDVLSRAANAGIDLRVAHVEPGRLSRGEIPRGRSELVDAETGKRLVVDGGDAARNAVRGAWNRHRAALEEACRAASLRYAWISTAEPRLDTTVGALVRREARRAPAP